MVIVLEGYFALLYFIFVIILYLFLSFFFGCPAWLVESQNLDQELLSRSGRKRRPASLLDGGILWFFSNCGATVGPDIINSVKLGLHELWGWV